MYDSEFDDLLLPPALASRESRLIATVADTVLVFAPALLIVPFAVTGDETLMGVGAVLAGVAWIALVVYQVWLLSTQGQSIGKRWRKICIVRHDDGSNPGFVGAVLMRGFLPGVVSAVPYLGNLFALANVLFIFAADRRCLHDHIAGTIVVEATPADPAF